MAYAQYGFYCLIEYKKDIALDKHNKPFLYTITQTRFKSLVSPIVESSLKMIMQIIFIQTLPLVNDFI